MTKKVKGSKSFSDFDYCSYEETTWRLKASCRNVDTLIFFGSPKSIDLDKAKSICSVCPVSHNCLYNALKYQYYGVWGNTTEEERKYITREIFKNDVSNLTLVECEKIVKMF